METASRDTASIDANLPRTVGEAADPAGRKVVPLHTEEMTVARRTVATEVVRVATHTTTHEALVDEPVARERIEVERVPIGRFIDAAPAVREEGDTTIIPVVEEVLVVEKRLVLKEEVRLKRIRLTDQHRETVVLREQEAVITRHRPEPESGL